MRFVSKFFEELTITELYEILKAREAVFLLEQRCICQDLDDMDYRSLHIFFEEDGKVAAYLRAYLRENGMAHMGRVLTVQRGTGLGGQLLREGIEEVRKKLQPKQIYIEAQTHAVGFYAREGFRVCSEEFMDHGIPHKKMLLDL